MHVVCILFFRFLLFFNTDFFKLVIGIKLCDTILRKTGKFLFYLTEKRLMATVRNLFTLEATLFNF